MPTTSATVQERAPDHGTLQNYIGGRWVPSSADAFFEDTNPATGRAIARVPLSTRDDVAAAVAAAASAWDAWRVTAPLNRSRHLWRLRALLDGHADELARVIVQDMGKTLAEARGEVQRAIENVEVAAGIPSLMMGYSLQDGASEGIDEEVVYEPLGVFAGISPFNFPVMVQSWFWPYAVATGNCWISKPSEQDPLPSKLLFELVEAAGFPPGVMNLVHGGREAVEALVDHPDVVGISFVGSTETARTVYARAASRGKRVQCGGGAKNALVVAPDARLDQVVANMVSSCYGCAGQRCLAGSIVIPLGGVREPLRRKFVEVARRLRVGNGLDPDVDMGPLISEAHRQRVLAIIEEGEAEGATVALDGRGVDVPGHAGYFVGPTVLDEVGPDMRVAREEIFGPVATFLDAEDLDQAIDVINASPFGNAATLYTSSGKDANDFRRRVTAGNIGINVGIAAPIAYFPFGGMKSSFFGDLHPQGKDSIRFFLEGKTVITRWP